MKSVEDSAPPPNESVEGLQEMGVLFVHGIGNQQRGDSLVDWTDSLYLHLTRLLTRDHCVGRGREFREQLDGRRDAQDPPKKAAELRKWTALHEERQIYAAADQALDSGISPVTISGTRLRSSADPDEPAHLTLTVTAQTALRDEPTQPDADTVSSWLIAESWWAQEFNAPPPKILLRWTLAVAPLVVLEHFSSISARSTGDGTWSLRRVARFVFGMILFLISLGLMSLIATFILTLLLLDLLPIPRVGAFARRLAARLATSVGDSYVLVASPSEYDAMVSRVHRDLMWLTSRCERVCVVAHSQGAVIAQRVLSTRNVEGVELFVTVGSGLAKLSQIASVQWLPNTRGRAWWVFVTASSEFYTHPYSAGGLPAVP